MWTQIRPLLQGQSCQRGFKNIAADGTIFVMCALSVNSLYGHDLYEIHARLRILNNFKTLYQIH